MTTYTTKTAKNGSVRYYDAQTGKVIAKKTALENERNYIVANGTVKQRYELAKDTFRVSDNRVEKLGYHNVIVGSRKNGWQYDGKYEWHRVDESIANIELKRNFNLTLDEFRAQAQEVAAEVEEPAAVEDYAVSVDAQDVAAVAEIELANQTAPTVEVNEQTFDNFKFEAGRTYFRLNEDGTPFTLQVTARTEHMLTATTNEGTRKYKIGINARGEFVIVGKDEDGYTQTIVARNEFIPAIVEIAKVAQEAFNLWAGKTPTVEVETDGSEEDDDTENVFSLLPALVDDDDDDDNREPEILNADLFVNLYQSPRDEKFANRRIKIGDERLEFRHHTLQYIAAPKTGFTLHFKKNGKLQLRLNGTVVAKALAAEHYMNSQLAIEQDKAIHAFTDSFKNDDNKAFFKATLYITTADNAETIKVKYFDNFNCAKAFVDEARKIFAELKISAAICHNKTCGYRYYGLTKDGTETFNLPDTAFFNGYSKDEIQSRIAQIDNAIADNEQAKENTNHYVWSELCTAIFQLQQTRTFYEFILRQAELINQPLSVNQQLAADIVSKLGGLNVEPLFRFNFFKDGRRIKVYKTLRTPADKFGTNIFLYEVFTDEHSFILDYVNFITVNPDDSESVETFHFIKPDVKPPRRCRSTFRRHSNHFPQRARR